MASLKFIAGAAVAVAVSAQAPAKPTWPAEFTATITRTDGRNHTDVTNTAFSIKNNGVIDQFKDPKGNAFTDFHDYAQHRDYFVDATGKCAEQPERGSILDRVPDLRGVTFNGTSTFNGVPVNVWNDDGGRGRFDIEYLTTQDAAQNPVAFTDARVGFTDAYSAFTAITTWPAGTFAKPAGCA